MNRTLVGLTLVAAPVALAVAALFAGFSISAPGWWSAAIHLAVLGGITPMIYGVNIRIVPVFARRAWRSGGMLVTQVAAGVAGAWLTFIGLGLDLSWLSRAGVMLALAGGLLFLVNLARLFRQPPLPRSGLPEPLANQEEVDAIATRFTRLSGAYLLLGLVLGVVLAWWKPDSGRWELAWAHLLLLGFFLTMASGVCYHVLSRWSGVAWRSPRAVRVHFGLVAFGLPLMVVALMFDLRWLFVVAGPIQAVALALFLVNVVPVAWRGPSLVRWGMLLAAAFLLAGITMGSLFASDVTLGPRLRQAHVTANLFGWSGLLISAFGYAFVPRFAGTSWRSPWLPRLQVGVLATGVALATTAWIWRGLAGAPDWAVVVPQVVVAVGLLAFAVQVAAAFMAAPDRQLHVLRKREGQAASPVPAGREWAAGRRDALP